VCAFSLFFSESFETNGPKEHGGPQIHG
jgi:hypothetical protein